MPDPVKWGSAEDDDVCHLVALKGSPFVAHVLEQPKNLEGPTLTFIIRTSVERLHLEIDRGIGGDLVFQQNAKPCSSAASQAWFCPWR